MRRPLQIAIVLCLLLSFQAEASYRVYQLKIEQYDGYGKLDRVYLVMSTLDPFQYEHYYAGYRWMRVSMKDTWYCPGDTGQFRKYCLRPKVVDRGMASLEHAKRVPLPYNRQPIIP